MKRFLTTLYLLLAVAGMALAQRTITGTVTGDDGEALAGASVRVKDSNVGATTDVDGMYTVQAPAGATTLVISYTGYTTQEVTLGASNVVDVVLTAGVQLGETVVTALGVTRDEKSLGYSAQSVASEDINRAGEANFVQALAAKAAGVQVTGSNGMAGASSFVLIRGANSITRDNQPLLVVDGIPIDNSQLLSGASDPIGAFTQTNSVAYSNRGIDLNQAEIESVTVLKGAAATALYGSQAGNGAIIITTRRGKIGQNKVSVDLSSSLQFSQINKTLELQDKYSQGLGGQYRAPDGNLPGAGFAGSWGALIDTLRYDGATDYPWDKNGRIVGQSAAPNGARVVPYDPYDFFNTGVTSNTNLGISAANNFGSLRFSIGFMNQTGIVPKNDFQKLNLGLNADSKLGEKMRLGIGVQYINSGGTRIEQGSNTSGVMLGLLRTPVTFDNSNGLGDAAADDPSSYSFPNGRQRSYRGYGVYDNPYWTVNNNPLNDDVNRIIGNVTFNWAPVSWLDFTYRPSVDLYTDFRKQYFAIGSATRTAGQVYEDTYRNRILNADALLTFKPQFNEDWTTNLTLAHTMYSNRLDRTYFQGDGLVVPNFYDISNASGFTGIARNIEYRLMRGSAILDLSYRGLLYLGGSVTLEGNTTLPEENSVYPYYGGNAAFIFSELMDQQDYLSFGKVRASFGLVGLGTAPFSTATPYESTTIVDGWTSGVLFPFEGTAGFTRDDVLGNPELKPERRRQWEVGLDVRFFKNRLGLDFSYYDSRSFDVILPVPITGSTGYAFTVLNAAELSNTGFEIVLNAVPVQGPFNWDIQVNFTKNKNNVEALAEGVDQVFLGGFEGSSVRAVVDNPYGTIFGFGFYKDANGQTVIGSDGYPILDPNEKAFESSLPDFQVGILNSFSYRGITLSALLDIKEGGYAWNGTRSALYFFGTAKETENRGSSTVFEGNVAAYDGNGDLILYDHDNDATTPDIPQTEGANTQSVLLDEGWLRTGNANGFFGSNTEDFIEETSWVRLREVTLAYTLPGNWLRGARIEGASLFVSGRNLWLDTPFKGIDPETNLYGADNAQGLEYFNMPNTKSYTVGVNLKF